MKADAAVVDIRAAGDSHPGRVRPRNEDRFHVDPLRGIFIVVDGIGGQAGGARAAEIALDAVRQRLERETGSIPDRLREAIASANEAIHEESQRYAELAGMGCVLTAAVVDGDRICAGHVGDTRLYKLRSGRIAKLTRDHSPVGDLEDEGRIDERDAMRHPRRNEVWRAVGNAIHQPAEPGFIDVVEDTFEADAALLLCTDGLSDSIGSAEISAIVCRHAGDPSAAVHDLIASANDAGGGDNVTAIVIEGATFADTTGFAAEVLPRRPQGAVSRMVAPFALGAAIASVAIGVAPLPTPAGSGRIESSPAVTAPSPRMLTVGGSNPDASTITAAVALARSGDTIAVEPGTYRESVVLPDGVSILSVSRHAAELRRPPGHVGAWAAITIASVASGTIRGFRIAGSASDPLDVGVVVTDADAAIEDLDVSGARDAALRISGTSSPTVHGCVLHDNPGFGIRVQDAAAPEITNTAVVRNGRGAIQVSGGAQPVLLWSVVQHGNRSR
jgi:PPM family protein phosphatase